MGEPEQIEGRQGGLKHTLSTVRTWLRRIMPFVALGAAVLFITWMFVTDSVELRESSVGRLISTLTFVSVSCTLLYYGLKALRWLKRKLLWRVRRRLIITYLFVGLTPIILMTLLGLLSAFGGSGQGMARVIGSQVTSTELETQAGAQSLAESFARLPANIEDQAIQRWLDERVELLRSTLPGARAAIWRGQTRENPAGIGHQSPAAFHTTSAVSGSQRPEISTPLPDWLRDKDGWRGVAYTLPEDPKDNFGVPSMRALIRGSSYDRPFALLLYVPVGRELVQRYRETTGINLRPFFLRTPLRSADGRVQIELTERSGRVRLSSNERTGDSRGNEGPAEEMIERDQFGEPLDSGIPYPVVVSATNWANGEKSEHLGFLYGWSYALAKQQFFGTGGAGEVWRQALWIVAIVFLVLELLALFAAAWMTRAVTGTVHKLHSAVDLIKRGDFSHRVKVRSHDQLGELAAAFNDMSANIEGLLEERVKHERLEREVEIAAQVQAQLFPSRVPILATAEISAECRAARGVAGDYYDYIEIIPGIVAIGLGDVSGKGVSASLVMSNLQAALRAQTTIIGDRLLLPEGASAAAADSRYQGDAGFRGTHEAEIEGAVARKITNINRQLVQSTESNRFATLFLGIYDDRSRRLRYCNAGHNAPILVRADGKVERLIKGGMMIGAFDWAVYEEDITTLAPGELLVIFSDGISEAENEAGIEFGEERLERFVVEHRHASADEVREEIFNAIDAWSGVRERGDDQTLVIVRAS